MCKLYSVYEEIPEEILDETDVDSYFYHNILDISQSTTEQCELAKDPTKTLLHSKRFIFGNKIYSSDLFSRKKSAFSKKKLSLYSIVWVNFSKHLIKPTKYRSFHYPNQKLRLGLQKQETNCSLIVTRMELSIWTDKFECRSGLKRTRLAFFPSKSLNITVINSFLQKLSTWVTAKTNISTRIDFLLLTSVTFLRAITRCSTFTPDCGYDNSTIILIGDVYCPNTRCLGNLCLHKKTFETLSSNDYQCPQCGPVCQVRNIPFEEQTKSFFLSLGQGVYVFEETPKSIQDLIGDVSCPCKHCFNREKCESLDGYVTTPRSIYACEK